MGALFYESLGGGKPIPLLAPVMTATFPSSFPFIVIASR